MKIYGTEKNIVAIIVPIYKSELTELEWISFIQLINVLGSYEVIIVAPENLSIPKIMKERKCRTEKFPSKFFQSVDSYSQLMLSSFFYERFNRYQYILIYQLDAFVFKNELEYFCSLGYDYIGAPWIFGVCEYANLKRKVLYVGNGGFSLRKVKACIDALKHNKDLLELYGKRNEDIFFSACDGKGFRVASKELALSFAFESEVRECFVENKKILPFGCHAWERYDFKFWKPYIEKFGYDLNDKELMAGEADWHNREKYFWMKRNTALFEQDKLFYGIPEKLANLFPGNHTDGYFLWGAGYRGKWIKDLLLDINVPISGFIDTNEEKQGNYIDNLMIYEPQILKKESRIIVTVRKQYYKEVEKSLKRNNLVHLQQYIFWEDILPEINRNGDK